MQSPLVKSLWELFCRRSAQNQARVLRKSSREQGASLPFLTSFKFSSFFLPAEKDYIENVELINARNGEIQIDELDGNSSDSGLGVDSKMSAKRYESSEDQELTLHQDEYMASDQITAISVEPSMQQSD